VIAYLFLGGPWHGQWHGVPDHRHTYLVPIMTPVIFTDELSSPLSEKPCVATYVARRFYSPAWRYPRTLTLFCCSGTAYATGELPYGTVLPGGVYGELTEYQRLPGTGRPLEAYPMRPPDDWPVSWRHETPAEHLAWCGDLRCTRLREIEWMIREGLRP
jgi:hypothetical protein